MEVGFLRYVKDKLKDKVKAKLEKDKLSYKELDVMEKELKIILALDLFLEEYEEYQKVKRAYLKENQ